LENEDGEEVDASSLTSGGKGVVIFVYPKVSPILLGEIVELMQFLSPTQSLSSLPFAIIMTHPSPLCSALSIFSVYMPSTI